MALLTVRWEGYTVLYPVRGLLPSVGDKCLGEQHILLLFSTGAGAVASVCVTRVPQQPRGGGGGGLDAVLESSPLNGGVGVGEESSGGKYAQTLHFVWKDKRAEQVGRNGMQAGEEAEGREIQKTCRAGERERERERESTNKLSRSRDSHGWG